MTVENLEFQITDSASEAANGIDSLAMSLQRLKSSVSTNSLAKISQAVETINTSLSKINTESLTKLSGALNSIGEGLNTEAFNALQQSLKGVDEELQQKPKDSLKAAKGINRLSASSSKATSAFAKLGSSLGRIALYRFLRSVIKSITDAFKEGAENAYLYSKAVGGSLYTSLTKLSSANQKMVNQLGAAWATLLQAITPILLKIISFATKAAELLTKVFSLFTGSTTYLKAKDVTVEWAESSAESATKAADAVEEWKNQLLGFDEINKLEDTTSTSSDSGSSSPTSVDYGDLFETATIDDDWLNLDAYDLGKKIGGMISDAIANIDWDNIWYTLFNAVRTGLDFVSGIIAGIRWEELPGEMLRCLQSAMEQLADSNLFYSAGTLVGNAMLAAIDFTKGFLYVTFGQYIDDELAKLSEQDRASWIEVGKAIVRGLLIGLVSMPTEIAAKCIEMAEQFQTGIRDALGLGEVDSSLPDTVPTTGGEWLEQVFTQTGEMAGKKLISGILTGVDLEKAKLDFLSFMGIIGWIYESLGGEGGESLESAGEEIGNDIIEGFSSTFEGEEENAALEEPKGFFSGFLDWVHNLFDEHSPSEVFAEIGRNLVEGFSNGFTEKWNEIKSKIEGFFTTFKEWWETRSLGSWDIKLPHLEITYTPASSSILKFFGIDNIPHISVSWYAQGGFPDVGDLFIANEQGAELVGSMNGKTTVANQEEIIEGIKRGVIEAMSVSNGNKSSNNSVTLNVNGKAFCRAIYGDMKSVTNEHGISLVNA